MRLLYLSASDVTKVLDIDEMLHALGQGLIELSAERASAPNRTGVRAQQRGLMIAMPGFVPGFGLATKVITVFPQNKDAAIASHHALILLFNSDTGEPLAVMDGGYITAMRTAGTAALVARELARKDSRVLALLGAGVQGAAHLEVFSRVLELSDIRIASRNYGNAAALAGKHPLARAVSTFREAINGADVVACCADASAPIIQRDWLRPGAHVSSVGGTFGPEVDAGTVSSSRIFVEWRGVVSNAPPVGAYELQGLSEDQVTEVGLLLLNPQLGRRSLDEVTLYKSTGNVVEDIVTCRLVYEGAVSRNIGTELDR